MDVILTYTACGPSLVPNLAVNPNVRQGSSTRINSVSFKLFKEAPQCTISDGEIFFIPGAFKIYEEAKETQEHRRAVGFAKQGQSVLICSNEPFVINSSPTHERANVRQGDTVTFRAAGFHAYFETYTVNIDPGEVVKKVVEKVVELVKESIEDCGACFSTMEYPHLLDECGHSFCMGCCTKLLDTTLDIHHKCPTCRTVFKRVSPNLNLNKLTSDEFPLNKKIPQAVQRVSRSRSPPHRDRGDPHLPRSRWLTLTLRSSSPTYIP